MPITFLSSHSQNFLTFYLQKHFCHPLTPFFLPHHLQIFFTTPQKAFWNPTINGLCHPNCKHFCLPTLTFFLLYSKYFCHHMPKCFGHPTFKKFLKRCPPKHFAAPCIAQKFLTLVDFTWIVTHLKIFCISHCKNSKNFKWKTEYKPISLVYESPMIMSSKRIK